VRKSLVYEVLLKTYPTYHGRPIKGTNSCGTRDTKTNSAQPSIATIHSIVCNSFVSFISAQSQSEDPVIASLIYATIFLQFKNSFQLFLNNIFVEYVIMTWFILVLYEMYSSNFYGVSKFPI